MKDIKYKLGEGARNVKKYKIIFFIKNFFSKI